MQLMGDKMSSDSQVCITSLCMQNELTKSEHSQSVMHGLATFSVLYGDNLYLALLGDARLNDLASSC